MLYKEVKIAVLPDHRDKVQRVIPVTINGHT